MFRNTFMIANIDFLLIPFPNGDRVRVRGNNFFRFQNVAAGYGPKTTMPDHRKPKTENRKLRICVPVVEANTNRARSKYLRAARKGLWTELRLDYLAQPDLKRLFRSHPGPVIATNRLAAEGGRWSGREAERRALLEEALALGADFLDLELAADPAWRRELTQRRGEAKIILSWHDFSGTPDTRKPGSHLPKNAGAGGRRH